MFIKFCNFLQFWNCPSGFRILQITPPLSPQWRRCPFNILSLLWSKRWVMADHQLWSTEILSKATLIDGKNCFRNVCVEGRRLHCWVRPCQWKEPKHLGRDLCVRYQGSKCGAPPYYPWDSFSHWMERYQADLQKSGNEGVIEDFIFNHIRTLNTYDMI